MVKFSATLQKFASKGEKTGWTYLPVARKIAEKIRPDTKRSFRVKGTIDDHPIKAVAMIPKGNGDYIIAVNAAMRKAIRKINGAKVNAALEVDASPLKLSEELLECFNDDPTALKYFSGLPPSHRNWYSNWVTGAKTEITRTKRIATVIRACSQKMDFGEMMRQYRDERKLIG
ncbi:MAG: YdeI/OmpD-associated family protein [Ferruginibacter sp.]